MNPAVHPTITSFDRTPAHHSRATRSVFLPKEHGSWSLALEPIIFGLLIVPSQAGIALALSAAAAFFIRRPMKATLKTQDRASILALATLSAAALFGFTQAVLLGGIAPLWPLLPAIPMGALYLYWDRENEGRAAAAELIGSGLFALVPAVMATLAGHDAIVALSLTALMLTRSAPTILTVRTWLRRRKGQSASRFSAVAATVLALATITLLTQSGHTPVIAHALVLLSCLRLTLLFARTPDWSAKRIGMGEAAFGAIYILMISYSYY